jgi:small subunit ribosomal protein S16
MLRIRLRRVGARKKPSYRLVVADIRSPRDGAFVENIGHYDPMTDPETIVVQEDRALHWLRLGAQPSETTARLLGKAGILDKFKPVKEKP